MEAIRSISHGVLSPTGNPILTKKQALTQPLVSGYQQIFTDSGTSALALALITLRQKFSHIAPPEVIIPGYGCPDLVAAALFAKLKPVIIDTDKDSPFYHPETLASSLTSNTIAVLAVNFLGITENIPALQSKLLEQDHPAVIIEDNAQWLPEDNTLIPSSPFSILSFGRGKPASLLGGGALLCKSNTDFELAKTIPHSQQSNSELQDIVKIHFYNQLIKPFYYQFLARNPLLNLGETVYHPLQEIETLAQHKQERLASNLQAHHKRPRTTEESFGSILTNTEYQSLIELFPGRSGRLLRFPVLCRSKEARDHLLHTSNRLGLGCSAMYQTGMDQIKTIPQEVTIPTLPNSNHFADRLITLPLHQQVSARHIERIQKVLLDT